MTAFPKTREALICTVTVLGNRLADSKLGKSALAELDAADDLIRAGVTPSPTSEVSSSDSSGSEPSS